MSVVQTPLSKKLGLKFPILISPMFLVSNADMLVAAAEAGVMAAMPALNEREHEAFRNTLAEVRRRTDKPFAINLMIKFGGDRLERDLEACLEFEVPVLITSLGLPKDIIPRAHAKGTMVFHDVIHLHHARKADELDVDAIIAVAAGAGGHAGTISPFVLGPYIKSAVKAPVILAGGISTGREVAASLLLGAELAYMGTRFIACTESAASREYKDMVVRATPDDLVYTDQVSGTNGNFLKETVERFKKAQEAGDPDAMKRWKDVWSAGQGVAMIRDVKPIGEIIEEVMREYRDAIASLPR